MPDLRKTLSVPVTASGNAILKIQGISPMSFRASKLNACFTARVYGAGPNTLTGKFLATLQRDGTRRNGRFAIRTSERIHTG